MDEINDLSTIVDSEVSDELRDYRLSFCRPCEFLVPVYIGGEDRWTGKVLCNECGCSVNYKTTRSDESCPIGKW